MAATAADEGWSEVFAGIERLRELAVGTAAGEPTRRKVFRREGEYWTVAYEGSLVRLQDSKGEGARKPLIVVSTSALPYSPWADSQGSAASHGSWSERSMMMTDPGQGGWMIYTSGDWFVKQGREDEFIWAWRDLAEWTAADIVPGGRAMLLRDQEDGVLFRSFGPWDTDEQVAGWRQSEGFTTRIGRIR